MERFSVVGLLLHFMSGVLQLTPQPIKFILYPIQQVRHVVFALVIMTRMFVLIHG